jgi:hypothetical protein
MLGGQRSRRKPLAVAVAQVTASGKRAVEEPMRDFEVRVCARSWIEAVLHARCRPRRQLVASSDRGERPQLRLQPLPPRRRLHVYGGVEQRLCLDGELVPWPSSRLPSQAAAENQSLDVLTERGRQLDEPPSDAHRSNSAAWPCPTPTQSVASP